MTNHIVKDLSNEPAWVEVGHGTTHVALAITDPITGKLSAVKLTPAQAVEIGNDLMQNAIAQMSEIVSRVGN